LPNLSLIQSGEWTARSSELLLSDRFDQLLREITERFDQVIIDTPPVFAADDAPTIASKMDGVLFVVRGHFTKAHMARQALDILYQRQATILGLIFNRADDRHSSYYYYKYADYYQTGAKGNGAVGKGKGRRAKAKDEVNG